MDEKYKNFNLLTGSENQLHLVCSYSDRYNLQQNSMQPAAKRESTCNVLFYNLILTCLRAGGVNGWALHKTTKYA